MDKLLKFNNKLIKSGNRIVCKKDTVDPYNPLNLPANTVRVRTSDGNVPTKTVHTKYDSATLVPGTSDVYDVYKSGTSFNKILGWSSNIIEVLGANTSNITDMGYMFAFCDSLTNVALFDTSNVTNMDSMFYVCSSLTNVPLFDTSNVTNMVDMLYSCSALQSVPLFETSKVTNMYRMFMFCSALQSVPLFDTSKVTNMKKMFENCTALTNVPLLDTSKVTDMESMFSLCTSLTSVPLFNTSSVTNMTSTFHACRYVQSGALALYQQASTQTNPPTSHSGTFRLCGSNTQTGAAELAQIPDDWK